MKLRIALLLGLCQGASAAMLEYKPLALETKATDQILIRGFDGDIRIQQAKGNQLVVKVRQETPERSAGALKQSLDEWNFSLQRVDAGIEISVQSPQAREVWRQILQGGGTPKFHLEISAPARTLELAWRSGNVSLDNWGAKAYLSVMQGQIQVQGGAGDLRAIGQEVEVRVKGRTGKVEVESYSGKVILEDIKGPLEVEAFSGEASVSRCEGQITLRTFKAPLNVVGGKGRVEFETIRGPLKITNFSGDLKGVSDEAAVTAKLAGAGDVRVVTQGGPVSLDVPGSGASVSASSVEGAITGPPHMRADQMAGSRVMRGRLKGSSEGTIVVRTQTGSIRIR